MKLYVVRHGQTDWNKLKKMQGFADIPLNEKGLEQAGGTRNNLNHVTFDMIYCSPLKRAKQTAAIINEDRNVHIIYDDKLKERNYGEFEGTDKSSFDYNEFWAYTLNKNYDSAENVQHFFSRISAVLEELKSKYPNHCVLIVAHAGVMKAIECLINGMLPDAEIGPYLPQNCGVKEYDLE